METDLLIVGTGPAGLTAALYAQRLGIRTVVLGDTPGGNLYMIELMRNWPGAPEGVAGAQLGAMMFAQAQQEGALFPMTRLTSLDAVEAGFTAETSSGEPVTARSVVLAMGVVPRSLGIPGEDKSGIHYCALCDGPPYRGKNAHLVVVGGGNMAAHEALILAHFAERVHILHRRGELRAETALQKELGSTPNIEIHLDAQVLEVLGQERAAGIRLATPDGGVEEVCADGVFVCVGWKTDLSAIRIPLETTEEGFIRTGPGPATSYPGVFAAGDIRDTPMRQVITACADGALAGTAAYEYVRAQRA